MKWLVLALCACAGTTGNITIELTTAPDSHVLDAVQRLRLTLTNPHQVTESMRGPSGFNLGFDLDPSGVSGALIVEGFDAGGALIACGQSPKVPIAAVNAELVIYMAPPRSFGAAPVALDAPLSDIAGAALPIGAVLVGGRDAGGAASAQLAIYFASNHTLLRGIPMPSPRAGIAVAAGPGGTVNLFGGNGADGAPTGTQWRFDTTAPPNGMYTIVGDQAGFARTGQAIVAIGSNQFLVTGAPPLAFQLGPAAPRSDIAALPAAAAQAAPADAMPTAIFAGDQLVRYRNDAFDTIGSWHADAAAATLPDGRVVVVGGGDPLSRDALVIDATTGMITTIPNALATGRRRPSLAATSRHLVVAGGSDSAGAPIATAELFDAHTLAPLAVLPILPRTGAFAAALPNDQVLLVGGAPASNQIELFTPEPP